MLSIIIITKNEEDVISDCIKSIQDIASEIVVVDGKSTDSTAKIAVGLGAKVIINPFENFSEQRNLALKHIKNDWFLYLDSDERATPEFKRELRRTLENFDPEGGIGGYYINRKTYYYNHDWGFTDSVQRLFHKDFFVKWQGVVHETPQIKGKFGTIKSPILHYTHRNLSQMLTKTNAWSEYEAKLRFDHHHPQMNTWRFVRVITTGFLQSYFGQKGYKNGVYGLIEAIYQGFSLFITYAKLWELQNAKKS